MQSEVNGILVAAHDLKAPLSLVRQLALSLELESDSAIRTKIQSQIVTVSERALANVNDLTKLARLEDGLFSMEPVSVRGICREVYQELEPLFSDGERHLALSFNNRSRLAVANQDLLRSIVHNFCTNALRYSEPGSTSQLEINENHHKIRIGVRDFGPALPTKVWRAFQQGGLSTPTQIAMRPDSSGLGLYLVSRFADYMNAEIGATRHRDGVSFFIDLPISKQAVLF